MKFSRVFKIVLFLVYVALVAWLCFGMFKPSQDIPRSLFGIPIDKVVHFLMFLPFPILGTIAFDFRSWWRALALTTLLALLSTLLFPGVVIEPVIGGAIMPLLPGLAVTNAMRDTIRGDLVSGGARVIEAILSVMMLAAGIGLMLSMWGGIRA